MRFRNNLDINFSFHSLNSRLVLGKLTGVEQERIRVEYLTEEEEK